MIWQVKKPIEDAENEIEALDGSSQVQEQPVHLHEPLSAEDRRMLELKVSTHRKLIDRINLS